jgi:predicted nucleic acid-binding protein
MAAMLTPPPRLVAVDTNVALDFAKGMEDVCDAIATIKIRIDGVELWLPPTVVQELAHAVLSSPHHEVRIAATKMLRQHRALGFRLVNFIPLGFDVVERIADRLRLRRLLPAEEVHDSMILAEAAALGCALLTSSDDHLRCVDHEKLARELARFDLAAPIIATPREIVRKFFR